MNASFPTGHGPQKNRSLLSCSACGLATALVLMLLLLIAATVIAYRGDDPGARVVPFSYIIMLVTALCGGYAAAHRRGKQGLLCGALTGIGLVAICLIGYLIMLGDGEAAPGRLALSYLIMIALSVLGGLAGGKMRSGVRRVRRRGRR